MTTAFAHIPGLLNLRDLGGHPTPSGPTIVGRLLRSDAPDRLGPEGFGQLAEMGVRTIIDLRHLAEIPPSSMETIRAAGIGRHHISLFPDLDPTRMGTDLSALYQRTLEERSEPIAKILRTVADAPQGAVLFHCTLGKDRTGIVAALLLALAGVVDADIATDYSLSEGRIAPLQKSLMERAMAQGVEPDIARDLLSARPATMTALLQFIATTYGSTAAYLTHVGLDGDVMARLRASLLLPQSIKR